MWQKIIIILTLPLVVSCSLIKQKHPAPVDGPNGLHIVQRGETLYSIAWRYNQDYREIAKINKISSPYLIYPGQKLHFTPSTLFKDPSQKILYQHHSVKLNKKQRIEQQSLVKKMSKNEWSWPTKGNIINYFTGNQLGSKGIDIAGSYGSPVKAAASGKVVYSGTGLRGYGRLLIIKHNETYLSAYAHNSRLIVKEGDYVKRDQPIAYMGNTESSEVKLHFEIRKNGKPINPLDILPSDKA